MRSRNQFSLAVLMLAAVVSVNAWSAEPAKDDKKSDDKVTVLVTKTGTKYHVDGCPHAKDATAILLSEAKGKYEACADCKPDATVYITKSGNKFHMKDCTHAKDATETTVAAAKFHKLEACKVCNPPDGKKSEKHDHDKKDGEKKDEGKMEK